MSDENPETPEEHTDAQEGHTEAQAAAAAALITSDGSVQARWNVAVIPGENVSIHFDVRPTNESAYIASVTASFALKKDHMVVDTYAGSTVQQATAAKGGQGLIGDVGVDTTVFPAQPDGAFEAILSGTVVDGDAVDNFMFTRPFEPGH